MSAIIVTYNVQGRMTYLRVLPIICLIALGARPAEGQVEVVGPSFVALSVPDLAASVQWYRGVFGLTVAFQDVSPDSATKVALLVGAGLRVELVWHRNAKSLSSYAGVPTQPDMVFGAPKIGFSVRDMDSTIAELRAQRATIEGMWLVRPSHVFRYRYVVDQKHSCPGQQRNLRSVLRAPPVRRPSCSFTVRADKHTYRERYCSRTVTVMIRGAMALAWAAY